MPSRHATGMKVADHVDIFLDRGDQIAFHDLHVVDVVKSLYARGVDGRENLKAPGGVVAHVVVMIDLAVQQFDDDGDAVVFADLFYAIEADDRVLRPFGVGHAIAIAGKRDDVGDARFGRQRNVLAEVFFDLRVIFDAIQRVGDVAATGVTHGADQPILPRRVPLFHGKQVDRFASDLGGIFAELIKRNVFVAPAGHRLLDVPLAWNRHDALPVRLRVGLRPLCPGYGGQ